MWRPEIISTVLHVISEPCNFSSNSFPKKSRNFFLPFFIRFKTFLNYLDQKLKMALFEEDGGGVSRLLTRTGLTFHSILVQKDVRYFSIQIPSLIPERRFLRSLPPHFNRFSLMMAKWLTISFKFTTSITQEWQSRWWCVCEQNRHLYYLAGNISAISLLRTELYKAFRHVEPLFVQGRNLYPAGLLLVLQGLLTFRQPIAGLQGTDFYLDF